MWHYYIINILTITLGLGAFILLRSRLHPARHAFLLFLASACIWDICLVCGVTYGQEFTNPCFNWQVALLVTGLLHGMSLLGFCVQFPTRALGSRRNRWLFALLVACTIWLLVMGSIISGMTDKSLYGIWKLLPNGMLNWVVCCLISSVLYCGWHLRAIHGQERLQIGYLLCGLGGVLCGCLWSFCVHHDNIRSLIASQCTLLTLIFPILASYALFCSPLIGLNRMIHSATINSVVIVLLSLLLILLLSTVNRILVVIFAVSSRWSYFCVVALFGLMFQTIREGVIRVRKCWGESSILKRTDIVLQQAIQTCLTTTEPRVLLGVLAQAIQQTMRTRSLAILRPAETGQWEKMSCISLEDRIPKSIANNDLLLRFYQMHTPAVFSDILVQQRGETFELGLQLQAWGVSLVQPVIADGKLTGLVLLGEKESGGAYTAEDLRFLHDLSNHVVLALGRTHEYENLRMYADNLCAQVNEQRTQLISFNREFQKNDEAKENFLAVISHELLTPLTAILGWIDVAQTNRKNPDIVTKALSVCLSNANRQRRLISDLLDASRLTHGKLSISRERCTLWELVTQSVESVQQMAKEKSLAINLLPPSTSILIDVDPIRFVQVISNLLTNAIKFTTSEGSITVVGSQENDVAKLAITDTGYGIAPEDLAHIFDLFHQGPYHQSGVGIGLTLVKGILELHGGSIHVSSPGVGHGSTFTIEIPIADAVVDQSSSRAGAIGVRTDTLMRIETYNN